MDCRRFQCEARLWKSHNVLHLFGQPRIWGIRHHHIRRPEQGESAPSAFHGKLGARGEIACELCSRTLTLCDHRKTGNESIAHNPYMRAWFDVQRLAKQSNANPQTQEEINL